MYVCVPSSCSCSCSRRCNVRILSNNNDDKVLLPENNVYRRSNWVCVNVLVKCALISVGGGPPQNHARTRVIFSMSDDEQWGWWWCECHIISTTTYSLLTPSSSCACKQSFTQLHYCPHYFMLTGWLVVVLSWLFFHVVVRIGCWYWRWWWW
jgi:hypothetical protein